MLGRVSMARCPLTRQPGSKKARLAPCPPASPRYTALPRGAAGKGCMTTSTHLLRRRRFLPLFATQLLNAFNDNLYKNAMVLFVVYSIYNSEAAEAQFSAIASGLFILPFFILSALSGQLADMRDKARIIRIIKACEIGIMTVGAGGLMLAWYGILTHVLAIPLMLLALFAMGVHSTFFGPIKYAILPQHLHKDEVLAGTGLVEAGTYIAILFGTILAGWIPVEWAAAGVILTALIGYVTSWEVPPAPPVVERQPVDRHVIRSSIDLIRDSMHDREVFCAIMAISFFWTIGAVLFIQFPPLAKNVLMASK
ncbi:MAG TPA: MFS transporter, partial [Planctomycetaceae bacterium]|nr:MFS transporter [Planctomycetaceae bacterium]